MSAGNARLKGLALIVLPAIALIAVTFWIASRYVEPAPPHHIVMTTGNELGAYHKFGRKYADILAKSGITLELKTSAGTIQNIARLNDLQSGVQVGLVQGGLAETATSPDLRSLGRTFLEPMWVFYRADLKVTRLADLADRRIAVGPDGSGTRPLVTTLLAASGVTASNATFLGATSAESAQLLADGTVDAIFFTMAAEGDLVQGLLRTPNINLLSFSQADAFTRLYPYLFKIVLPAGVIDLAANIPATDVTLLAPAATLVVRKDLHPALVGLLVGAVKEVHSGTGLFQKSNEFPQAVDTELPINEDAARYYKNGPPLLQRYLPFWLATFLDRMRIMIIPIAGILLPMSRILPMLYQWRIKRRMLYWYDQLKKLERQVRTDKSPERLPEYRAEVQRIEDAVSVIRIPLAFSDQLYNLRQAIDLVRQRLAALQAGG